MNFYSIFINSNEYNHKSFMKDSPGVKSHCIRGVKDLLGIPDRRRGRSKYGAEKPKSIYEWKMPLELIL